MKIFAISDLHLSFSSDKPMDIFGGVWEGHFDRIAEDWNARVSDEDVVIVAGDLSWAMTLDNAKIDFAHLAPLHGKKVIVKGNHDYWWSSLTKVKEALPEDFYCIQNNAFRLGGCVFCGTRGWVVPERNKILSPEDLKIHDREALRLRLSLAEADRLRGENDKLIVVMHYPPMNTLGADSVFTEAIREYRADAVVYGHLHGKKKGICLERERDGIPYYLTSCDLLENRLIQIF